MSPVASDEPSKKLAGTEFGFDAGTVGLKDLGASYPRHGVGRPFTGLQEKVKYKKWMLLSFMGVNFCKCLCVPDLQGVRIKGLLRFYLIIFTLNITLPKMRYHSIANEMA